MIDYSVCCNELYMLTCLLGTVVFSLLQFRVTSTHYHSLRTPL